MAPLSTFDSPQPILDALDAMFPSQRDHHVRSFRSIINAYGSVQGWHDRMAEREAGERRLRIQARVDQSTADFLARRDQTWKEWSERH